MHIKFIYDKLINVLTITTTIIVSNKIDMKITNVYQQCGKNSTGHRSQYRIAEPRKV